MATDCAPLRAHDPEVKNGSHRSLGGKRLSPLAPPLPAAVVDRNYSPSTRRRCSSRILSAVLIRDRRTSSANGAIGRHDRHDSAGMRLVTAASR